MYGPVLRTWSWCTDKLRAWWFDGSLDGGGPEPGGALTWRRCLLLCAPALVLGGLLRIAIVAGVPEAVYGPDANSYFESARSVWTEGGFKLGEKRRWIYPVLLVAAPLAPVNAATAISVGQHLAGLASILAVGWIAAHLCRHRLLWVPLVTSLWAVWPRMLRYEHDVSADALVGVVFPMAVACLFPAGAPRRERRFAVFMCLVTALLALKPHARPLWLCLLAAAFLLYGAEPFRRRIPLAMLGLSALMIFTSGSGKQASWLMLSSTLPLVRTQGEPWPEYRRALEPVVSQFAGRPLDYPWVQGRYKKALNRSKDDATLGDVWTGLVKDEEKFRKVCRRFAIEGIFAHPWTCFQMTLVKIGISMADQASLLSLDPRRFWPSQVEENEGRWEKRPKEMELYYRVRRADWNNFVEERMSRPFLIPSALASGAEHWLAWAGSTPVPGSERERLWPTWLGCLALAGSVVGFARRRSRQATLILACCVMYLLFVFAIGDTIQRYVLPVDWCGLVFCAVACDSALSAILRGRAFLRDRPRRGPGRSGSSGHSSIPSP